jgi:hypothetical protein
MVPTQRPQQNVLRPPQPQ